MVTCIQLIVAAYGWYLPLTAPSRTYKPILRRGSSDCAEAHWLTARLPREKLRFDQRSPPQTLTYRGNQQGEVKALELSSRVASRTERRFEHFEQRSQPTLHTASLVAIFTAVICGQFYCGARTRRLDHATPVLKLSRRALFQVAATGFGTGVCRPLWADAMGGPRRAVLQDTREGTALAVDPRRYLRAALQRSGLAPRVVFAGEVHPDPLHHQIQLEMIKAVRELDDKPLLIGLEMFYRQQQRALDEFVFGDGSLDKLAERTKWDQTWGYDIDLYAEIFKYAREEKIRLCGLNCPREIVSLVNQRGIQGLTSELAAELPNMDLDNSDHFERFTAQLEAAGARDVPRERLTRMYEAQTLRDEYMAASIAGYLSSPLVRPSGRYTEYGIPVLTEPAPASSVSRMVVCAGIGHIQGHVGIPDRVTRRNGVATFSMVPVEVPWTSSGKPVIEKALNASDAEWVIYTENAERDGTTSV